MKKKVILIIFLIQVFFNYSIECMQQVINTDLYDNLKKSLTKIGDFKLNNLGNINNISKLIDWNELGNEIMIEILKDDTDLNLSFLINPDLINKKNVDKKLQKLIGPHKKKLIEIIVDFIPVDNYLIAELIAEFIPVHNYSKWDKIALLENNADLFIDIIRESLNHVFNKKIDKQTRTNISKRLIANKLALKITSQDFKDVILGISFITSLWLFGHAICHECMEFVEPERTITALFAVFIITGLTYYIVNKFLKTEDKNKLMPAANLVPSVFNYMSKKLGK